MRTKTHLKDILPIFCFYYFLFLNNSSKNKNRQICLFLNQIHSLRLIKMINRLGRQLVNQHRLLRFKRIEQYVQPKRNNWLDNPQPPYVFRFKLDHLNYF